MEKEERSGGPKQWSVWFFILLSTLPLVGACGLVFQGRTQEIALVTVPDGATGSLSGEEIVTPGAFTVDRREPFRVVRLSMPGYRPACKLLTCSNNPAWVTLDCFPAAIPLLVDLALGTLRRCPHQVSAYLEPLESGSNVSLPSDEEIIDAAARDRVDLCELAPGREIIVTSGSISQPYEILGTVEVGEKDFKEQGYKQSMENLDRLLRLKALKAYGSRVDAIINVSDQHSGAHLGYSWGWGLKERPATSAARGLAVHFAEAGSPSPASQPGKLTAPRLQQLQELRERGLISQEEYERKRAEILKEL